MLIGEVFGVAHLVQHDGGPDLRTRDGRTLLFGRLRNNSSLRIAGLMDAIGKPQRINQYPVSRPAFPGRPTRA